MTTEQKRCPYCGQIKSLKYFYTNPHTSGYCKSCVKSRVLTSRAVEDSIAWWGRKFSRFMSKAIIRGYEVDLTPKKYRDLQMSPCFYCGESYERKMSIDRVDNSKGYLLSNCVSACYMCNRYKGAVTVEICRQTLAFIDK